MNPVTKEQLLEQLHSELTLFFLDNNYEKAKADLWQWFTAWLYFRKDVLNGQEAAAALFFYEQLTNKLSAIHSLLNKLDGLKT